MEVFVCERSPHGKLAAVACKLGLDLFMSFNEGHDGTEELKGCCDDHFNFGNDLPKEKRKEMQRKKLEVKEALLVGEIFP